MKLTLTDIKMEEVVLTLTYFSNGNPKFVTLSICLQLSNVLFDINEEKVYFNSDSSIDINPSDTMRHHDISSEWLESYNKIMMLYGDEISKGILQILSGCKTMYDDRYKVTIINPESYINAGYYIHGNKGSRLAIVGVVRRKTHFNFNQTNANYDPISKLIIPYKIYEEHNNTDPQLMLNF